MDVCSTVPAVHAKVATAPLTYSGNKLQWCGSDVRGTQKAITRVGCL